MNRGRVANGSRQPVTALTEFSLAAYLVVDTLRDNPALCEEYKVRARPLAKKYGGEYLARGGDMTLKETDLWSPTRLVLTRFCGADRAGLSWALWR